MTIITKIVYDNGEGMFSRKRRRVMSKHSIIGIALVLVMVLTSGCYYFSRGKDQECVDEMNKAFPDDHFEYLEPVYSDETLQSKDFYVSSKNYPDMKIRVKKSGSEVLTNYNLKRYEKEIEDYFHDYFESWYGNRCDLFEVSYNAMDNNMTPATDMTSEEYIKTCVTCNCVSVYLFSTDMSYLSEEENREILLDICRDREEACRIYVQWAQKKTGDWTPDDYNIQYTLDMKDKDTIEYLAVRYQDYNGESRELVRDLEIR